jgi:transposase
MLCSYCEDKNGKFVKVFTASKRRNDRYKCLSCGHIDEAFNLATEDEPELW